MSEISQKKRIWGWYFFDWASQPYNTLILTFIFGPYFALVASDALTAGGMDPGIAKAKAQAYWGYGLTVTGLSIAILAPILGSISDNSGRKMPWIWLFSMLYFIGSMGLWLAAPGSFSVIQTLVFFGIGLIGMEFATIFTNAYLPTLGKKDDLGRISGTGWAFGYVGGVVSLLVMLGLFQATETGNTMLGLKPLFGLDPLTKADTRIVGPMTAIWFAVFMIPFFLYMRDDPTAVPETKVSVMDGIRELGTTLASLPSRPSLFAYLGSSMFYRDALNGLYTFGGIYALGVLDWSITQVGVFGILGAVSGAVFCYIAGYIDKAIGPKPVIIASVIVLMLSSLLIISLTPTSVLWVAVPEGSNLPNIAFYIAGAMIGAGGGVVQSASRNMMTRQAHPDRMTEAFGLYALSGKATSFMAPLLIALASDITGSQRLGVTPLVALFLIGLILLLWVKPDGENE
ncbi:MFS transporter [Ascidiaceihabitans sp.]|uniref:MFS transporter n=1 Tax=Ascidiaceihabitans sp. TaxID=1872644 RepID=UPI0032993719